MTSTTSRVCFLCGGKGDTYARVDQHDYLRCSGCGLVYVDSIASPDQLYQSYDGGFFKSLRRKIFMPFRKFEGARHFHQSMERANRIFDSVLLAVGTQGKDQVFLDIGCNKGFLLAAAVAHGWNIYGVELVPELTIPFKRRFPQYGGQIYSDDFSKVQQSLKDGLFDAVSAIDVIEHFEDPLKEVGNIYRLLKPGGILLVQTPDTDNPKVSELKEKWGALKPKEHLHLFNGKNLRRFAQKLGFKAVEYFDAFDAEDGNLVAVLKK
jgi:SAM-dependent methyltransferase